uniref:Uncharacterized protein n=1 Tax=Peronospora matthiolae TaxID=2874970 RepID=A0AAV1VHB1_9STRA
MFPQPEERRGALHGPAQSSSLDDYFACHTKVLAVTRVVGRR